MTKIIAVIGSTGGQGGSVVQELLKQGEYKVRGITRNVNSEKAKALSSKGVEMVAADLNDEASLVKAFEGVTAIYAVTDFFEPFQQKGKDYAMEVEYKQGVNIANAALKTATLKHFIRSTLPDTKTQTNGKFVLPHFDAKVRVDNYIKSKPELLAKTTFIWITFYSTNYFLPPFQPNLLKSIGTYTLISPISPSTPFALAGDISVNVGIFTRAILSNPFKTLGGKYVFCNVQDSTYGDCLQLWAKSTGKRAQYLQVTDDAFEKLFPVLGEEITGMLHFYEYAGDKAFSSVSGEELITAADLGVQGELVTPEEAFKLIDWSPLDN